MRADARAALEDVVARLRMGRVRRVRRRLRAERRADGPQLRLTRHRGQASRVTVGALGLEGIVIELHGKHAEIDVRGKRLRAPLRDLRVIGGAPPGAERSTSTSTCSRAPGSLTELNVIGYTVDEALTRLEKFLDESTVTDIRELRIVHGHGTGQLRRAIAAFLKDHPLVANFETRAAESGRRRGDDRGVEGLMQNSEFRIQTTPRRSPGYTRVGEYLWLPALCLHLHSAFCISQWPSSLSASSTT